MNTSTVGARRLLGLGAAGAAGAASVNAVIYGLGRASGLTFVASTTSSGPQHIMLQHVVSLTLMTFAVGLVAALVVDKVRRPSLRALQIVGATVAVLSISMDVSIDSTISAKATLALMHLVVGVAFVGLLERARASRSAYAVGTRSHAVNAATRVGRVAA
jgi:Family of unknown function (DUF6069)